MTNETRDPLLRPALAFFAICAAATAAALMAPLAGSDTLFAGAGMDALSAVRPHFEMICQALREGRLPLWNPHILTGQPELAGAQWGIFYPFETLLLPFLGATAYVKVTIAFHLALLSIAGFMLADGWLKALGVKDRAQAASFAGVAIGLSGASVGHVLAGHVPIVQSMPFIVLASWAGVEWICGRDAFGVVVSVMIALSILAGGPQILPFGLMAAGAIWLAVALERLPQARFRILGVFGFVILGVALAGVQVLPSLELAAASLRSRVDLSGLSSSYLLEAAYLPGFLIPGWASALGSPTPWEFDGFLGAPVLALALAGVVGPARRRPVMVLAAASALLIVLASPLGQGVQAWIPGLSMFRVPSRTLLAVMILVPLVASTVVSRLVLDGRLRRSALVMLVMLTAVGGIAIIIRPGTGRVDVLLAMVWCLVGIAVLGLPNLAGRLGIWLMVLAGWVAMTASAAGAFQGAPRNSPSLARQVGPLFAGVRPAFRVVSTLPHSQNDGMESGFYHLGGYEPFASWRSALLLKTLQTGDPAGPWERMFVLWPNRETPKYSPLWDVLSVRLVLAEDGFKAPQHFREVHSEGGATLWENQRAFPRARFAACLVPAAGPEEILTRLGQEGENPAGPYTEGAVSGNCASGPVNADVRFIEDAPEQVRIEVRSNAAGYVVLSDLAYPGWTATVDGNPQPILPANAVGRAVAVPEGPHEVVFSFRPISFRIGGLVTLATAFLLLLVWIIPVIVRRRYVAKLSLPRKESDHDTR